MNMDIVTIKSKAKPCIDEIMHIYLSLFVDSLMRRQSDNLIGLQSIKLFYNFNQSFLYASRFLSFFYKLA